MAKVVYNACYGGFSLSAEAVRLGKHYSTDDAEWAKVNEPHGFFYGDRHDKILVRVVEELGEAAYGDYASLSILELPDGTAYRIDEYDGNESVMTVDDYEWTVAQ